MTGLFYCRHLRVPKIITVLLFILILQVRANGYSQYKLSLSVKNASLESVFKEIQKKTGVKFLYNVFTVRKADKVTFHVKDMPLESLLALCSNGQSLVYTISDNTVIVKEAAVKLPQAETKEATDLSIQGKVTDEEGNALLGVTILIKGTKSGTVTDAGGNYKISVPETSSRILVFSFIGKQPHEVTVTNNSSIDVTLKAEIKQGQEVVVMGYGKIRKKDISGSVSTISGKELQNTPVARADQALQGRVPGLQITSTSGEPGTGMKLRIRGVGSIKGSSDPLLVVDGIIGGVSLNAINPYDIQDVQVLKDASSTAIYGSRGANGVILITTKRGRGGDKDRISVDFTQGWANLPKNIDMLRGYDYVDFVNEEKLRNGNWPMYMEYDEIKNTNWQKELTRVASQRNANVSLAGAKPTINYYINGSYRDEEGIIENTGFKRAQFRTNIDKKIGDRVTLGVDFNVSHVNRKLSDLTFSNDNFWSSMLAFDPTVPIYDNQGNYAIFNNKLEGGKYPNLLSIAKNTDKKQSELTLTGKLSLDVMILKDLLTFTSSISTVYNNTNYHRFVPAQLDLNNRRASLNASINNNYNLIFTNFLTFTPKLGKNEEHSIIGTLGAEYQKSNGLFRIETNQSGIDNRTGPYNLQNYSFSLNNAFNRPGISGGLGDNPFIIASAVARIVYSYKGKYIFTGTARMDGASPFGADNKYAVFPAASAAWHLSEEDFMKDSRVFSNLKLRTSYGLVGNSALTPYSTQAQVNSGGNAIFGTAQDVNQAFSLTQLGNPALRWEKSKQFDIGLEAGLFNNRISFEVDYYNRITDDLLFDVPVPLMTGFNQFTTNVGKISNSGIELLLNTTNINTKNFTWNTTFNIAANKNKVVELGGGADNVAVTKYGYGVKTLVVLKKDAPLGSFWGLQSNGVFKNHAEVDAETAKIQYRTGGNAPRPGGMRYKDLNGDNVIDDNDYGITGNPNPKFFGGITNEFNYKRFSLKVFLKYSYGNDIFSWGFPFFGSSSALNNNYAFVKDRWREDRQESNVMRSGSRDYVPSDYWIQDGSYLKIGEVTFNYNIPVNKSNGLSKVFNSLSVYATGYNLHTFTKYSYGFDPDVTGFTGGYQSKGSDNLLIGIDGGVYPHNRVFSIGLRAGL